VSDKTTIKSLKLQEFSYKKFNKTKKQDEIGLVKLKLKAQQTFEDDFFDNKLTSVLAYDSDGNNYVVYYLDSVEVYDGDAFTVYAIPCSLSSFDNIGGGATNVIVFLGSYFE